MINSVMMNPFGRITGNSTPASSRLFAGSADSFSLSFGSKEPLKTIKIDESEVNFDTDETGLEEKQEENPQEEPFPDKPDDMVLVPGCRDGRIYDRRKNLEKYKRNKR